MALLRERPNGRPVQFGVGIQARRHDVVRVPLRVDVLGVVKLSVAEELRVVGVDCLSIGGEIGETSADADLVFMKAARIPLEGLAQRADLRLLARAALAGALAAQAAPERTQGPAPHAEIASRPIDMQPGIGLVGSALQPGHDATDRAYQVAVFRQRCFRGHGARATAVADGPGAGLQLQGHGRAVRTEKVFVAAGRALRTAHDAVARARERSDVHRHRLFVQWRRIIQHQPLDDFRRNQPVQRIQQHGVGGKRFEGGLLAHDISEKLMHFLVTAKPVSQAGPAGSFSIRPKYGTEQRLYAAGAHQHPRHTCFKPVSIHLRKALLQILVANDHGELGRGGPCGDAEFFHMPCQTALVTQNFDARFRQALLRPARRGAERRPVGRPAPVHSMPAGDYVAPGGK